jgi:hypothetical protein
MNLKIGDKVGILSESNGWGDVRKGDFGIINSISGDNYNITVPGKTEDWLCRSKNIIKCAPRVVMTSPEYMFIKSIVDIFGEKKNQSSLRGSYMTESKIKRILSNIKPIDTDMFNTVKQTVESVSFENTNMIVETKEFIIKHKERGVLLRINVGKFKYVIDFLSLHIAVHQRIPSKQILHYPHPHVSDSRPCFGSYYNPIMEAVRSCDIIQAITIMNNFLGSCAYPGWYHSVLSWATLEELQAQGLDIRERCSDCNELLEECNCSRCSICDSLMEDCSCIICSTHEVIFENCGCCYCPENNERLEEGVFPDSECSKCANLCRNLDRKVWECRYNRVPLWTTAIEDFVPDLKEQAFFIISNGIELTAEAII